MPQLILFILAIFFSCSKETVKPNVLASEYFPNSVGNYWEYDVYDSTSSKRYNVTVNITGTQKLADSQIAYVYKYQYPWASDTNYVRVDHDTVKVYDKFRTESINGLRFPLKIFLIPFQDGQRWDGKLLAIDSSHVTNKSTITVPLETFKNGFSIYHHYIGPNIEYNDTYNFIPNVGMVKIYYYHYDLAPPTRVLWQLKKYYLK